MSLHISPQLKRLAYRMLGSAADAEDMVQEAWLRLHQADPKPDSEEAFLYRVVSNLCIDRLRRLKVERKHYFGPWLPEPVTDASLDVEDIAEAADDLNVAFMLLLEALSPAERIVYILREGFDFSYTEISGMLQISAANARQRAHRAKQRLHAQRPRLLDEMAAGGNRQQRRAAQKDMLAEMAAKVSAADISGLVEMMHEEAIVYTDGGGVVSAAIRPIEGRRRIAQVAVFLAQKNLQQGPVESVYVAVNGGWSIVNVQHGAIHTCTQVELRGGRLYRVYVMRNPHKLIHLTEQLSLQPALPQ